MKLHEIPRQSKIYCETSDGSNFVVYDHPDGMYSYCKSENGGVVHFSLNAPLEVFRDGYKFEGVDYEDKK